MSFEIEGNKLVRYIHEKDTKSISIPEGIEIVGSGAFKFDFWENPKSLKEVILPKSLLVIDDDAFCDLKGVERIVIQDGLREIRKDAFRSCMNLKEIYLPDTLEVVGEGAFSICRELEKVVVPSGVRVLSKDVFAHCSNLKEVILSDGLLTIEESVIDGDFKIQELIIPASVVVINPGAFTNITTWGVAPKLTVDLKNENYVTGIDGAVYSKDMKTLVVVPEICKEETFTIPDGVETVANYAFCGNNTIRKVVVPSTVIEIGESAFSHCKALYWIDLPESVETIGAYAFSGCHNMKKIVIPNGVETIGAYAFSNCRYMDEIVISNGVKAIGEYAFSNCGCMKKMVIPNGVKTIGDGAFSETIINTVILPITIEKIGSAFNRTIALKEIEFVDNDPSVERIDLSILSIPKSCCRVSIPQRLTGALHEFLLSKESIDVYWTCIKSEDPLEIASVMLYQRAKEWENWVGGYVSKANEIISKALEIFESEKKIPANAAKKITTFATKCAKKIDENVLRKLITDLKNKGQKKVAESFENSAEIKWVLSVEAVNPIEEFVDSHIGVGNSKIESVVKKGIKYADGSGISSKNAVVLIITQYMLQWSKYKSSNYGSRGMVESLSAGYRLKKDEVADQVAEALDREELMAILEKQAYGTDYCQYIIAFTRYADEKQIKEFVKTIYARKKGSPKNRMWAQTAENALYLSDCIAAAEYMDKNKMLQQYAQMRGISETDFRDSRMVENFGFNENGVILFDIGDNTVELSITYDAKIQLFDVGEQKIIKRFPKKSGDAKKLCKSNDEFKELKKNIEDFIAKRIEYFNVLYLNGQYVTHGVWTKTYLTHPIIRVLARLLIWKDEAGKLFVVTEEGAVDINGQTYAPNGDVKLAHILEMEENEIDNWRKFLADRKQKQLFAQIWEPLVNDELKELNKRYDGVIISNKDRNAFKKAMKIRGVEVKSAAQKGEYDYSVGKYEFSNEGTMCIGDYADLSYTVDENTKDLTLGNLRTGIANERVLNVLVYELDKVCIRAKIARDEVDQIQVEQLDSFNLAQINEFINYATECKSVKCTAMFMDYKNKKYPDFDWLDELILEL